MPFATDSRQKPSLIALEDAADYKAFERAIKSDYSPQTAVEGQLVSSTGLPAVAASPCCDRRERAPEHTGRNDLSPGSRPKPVIAMWIG